MTCSHLGSTALVTGFDFSTGSVKGLAFDLRGQAVAEVRLPTDLWTCDGVSELNLCQLEGQVRAAVRAMAHRLRELGRLSDWQAIGISATHHTAGRIDRDALPVRRAICWNDGTLADVMLVVWSVLVGRPKFVNSSVGHGPSAIPSVIWLKMKPRFQPTTGAGRGACCPMVRLWPVT